MKYRTRKFIESAIDTLLFIFLILATSYVIYSYRSINVTLNYKKIFYTIEDEEQAVPTYFEGNPQHAKSSLQRENNVFIGDLEFAEVDPLSMSEFENGVWDASRISGGKSYYRNDKKLSSSTAENLVDYFDPAFDYIAEDKTYRDLLELVNRKLEYKDDSKNKKEGKKKLWGQKGKQRDRHSDDSIDASATAQQTQEAVVEFTGKKASELHQTVLSQMATATTNSASSKILHYSSTGEHIHREQHALDDEWSNKDELKLYVVPIGLHIFDYYEKTKELLDAIIPQLQQDASLCLTWSELEYFQRWYKYKSESDRVSIQSLVQSHQLEFILNGMSGIATEGLLYEDMITSYELTVRWFANEFNYKFESAYSYPHTRISRNQVNLIKEGGIDFLLIDGLTSSYYNAASERHESEFLWTTDVYSEEDSRLLVHLNEMMTKETKERIEKIIDGDKDTMEEMKMAMKNEAMKMNDGRYLMMWSIEDKDDLTKMKQFVDMMKKEGVIVT